MGKVKKVVPYYKVEEFSRLYWRAIIGIAPTRGGKNLSYDITVKEEVFNVLLKHNLKQKKS